FKSHEAWHESRRTDVPLMPAAPGSAFPGHNRPPFRYPYADDEKNLNSVNVEAAMNGVVDHFWGKQLWWDTRTGVN
ncbi:MAG TPA: SusD/RagB family nutrient-binding outer membrane lipoprotein, partial [Bacteroides sp.]|nr:SusD/RagB family nutrient-binding outer membrane lipoprotein [Bacteroides sp.]